MFDPYRKWLGIPPEHRPPTHYQLLSLATTEDDPEVIEEAAIRQSAHLRTYQLGEHAAECTRLLNEIAIAKKTLLTPALRKKYDAELAAKARTAAPASSAIMPAGARTAASATAPPPPLPRKTAVIDVVDVETIDHAPPRRNGRSRSDDDDDLPRRSRKSKVKSSSLPIWIGIGAGGFLGVLILAAAVIFLFARGNAGPKQNVAVRPPEKKNGIDPPPIPIAVNPNPIPAPIPPPKPKPAAGLKDWGEIVDEDGDCRFEAAGNSLRISVPATHHELHGIIGVTNAPRVMQTVDGDFDIQVKVTGALEPTLKTTGRSVGFHGAGLVLWVDRDCFLRVERNAWMGRDNRIYGHNPLLAELHCNRAAQNNSSPGVPILADDPVLRNPLHLRLTRVGNMVVAASSPDGNAWTPRPAFNLPLPRSVQVGVSVTSTTVNPVTFEFSDMVLVRRDGEKKNAANPVLNPIVADHGNGKRTIDLIALFDPADVVKGQGKWNVENGRLECTDMHFAPRTHFPYKPPEEYDYTIKFSQRAVRHGANLIMPNGQGKVFHFNVGWMRPGPCFSLSNAPNSNAWLIGKAETFRADEPCTAKVEVRKAGIRCFIDGKLVAEHNDFATLVTDNWRTMPNPNLISLGCDDPTTFHEVRLTEISGPGEFTRVKN